MSSAAASKVPLPGSIGGPPALPHLELHGGNVDRAQSAFQPRPPRSVGLTAEPSLHAPRLLTACTLDLVSSYVRCNPAFNYESAANPRRILTVPERRLQLKFHIWVFWVFDLGV